jgi:hypothetical protein
MTGFLAVIDREHGRFFLSKNLVDILFNLYCIYLINKYIIRVVTRIAGSS